jgi:cytochrome c
MECILKLARNFLLMGVALIALPAANAGDATAGAKVFATECSECHSVHEGKDKKGPSLFGVVDAKSAQRAGFAYSDALHASGLAWSRDNLAAYITNPRKLVPGGKMKYDGLADAKKREDLIAYLETAAKR